MIVRVEMCWNGRNLRARLTLPDGSRESVPCEAWSRRCATKALDIIENVYGLKRRNIRFQLV